MFIRPVIGGIASAALKRTLLYRLTITGSIILCIIIDRLLPGKILIFQRPDFLLHRPPFYYGTAGRTVYPKSIISI